MTYKDLLKKLAHFQVEHPYLTILIIAIFTVIVFGGVSKVKTVASLEQMMPTSISEINSFNNLRDFGLGQDMIAIVLEVNSTSSDPLGVQDITDKRVFDYIQHIDYSLTRTPDVLQTYSLLNVFEYALQKQGITFENQGTNILDKNLYQAILNNNDLLLQKQIKNYVNDDKTITFIIINTDVSANDPRMNSLATKIKSLVESSGHPPGVQISLTGTPIIQQKLGQLIAKDRLVTQRISTILVFLITMILFGTFTSAIVPIIVVTISVNWLYGIMGYTNLPISTLAGGVAAMVIGIGIDYAIHLMNRFKNERKSGKTVKKAIEIAVQNTGTALTGAAIATILAFLAFLLGSMPEMNRFGLLMSIGVGASFLLSLFGLPALLVIEEKIIHLITKRLKFGPEGDLVLYEEGESHPDHYEVVEPSIDELKTLAKKYKVCKVMNDKNKNKKLNQNNNSTKNRK